MPIVRLAFCAEFPTLAKHHAAVVLAQQSGAPAPEPLPKSVPCPLRLLVEGLPADGDPFAKGLTPGARALFKQGGVRAAVAGAKTVAESDEIGLVTVRTTLLKRLLQLLLAKDGSAAQKHNLGDLERAQAQVVEAVLRLVKAEASFLGQLSR